jgi:GrpE
MKKFLTWKQNDRQIKQLALQAEAGVRQLSNLPEHSTNTASDGDIVSILKSTCLLLDRLLRSNQTSHEVIQKEDSSISDEFPPEDSDLSDEVEPEFTQAEVTAPERDKIVAEPEPSATAKDLIKLRDWLLLAQSDDTNVSPEVLREVYRKLGHILEKEAITTLEATGEFNYEQQQVLDTHITDDLAQDNQICHTIRPGYLFNNRLLRPQEVIVYTFTAIVSD